MVVVAAAVAVALAAIRAVALAELTPRWNALAAHPDRANCSSQSFASMPAPLGTAHALNPAQTLWERVYPRRRQRSAWHGLRPCSRVNPLPQGSRRIQDMRDPCGSGLVSRKGRKAPPAFSSQT
ncbi:hypothetical protein D3C79_815550 [compost metagenome]